MYINIFKNYILGIFIRLLDCYGRTYTRNTSELQALIDKLGRQLESLNRPDNPSAQIVTIEDLKIDEFNLGDWLTVP